MKDGLLRRVVKGVALLRFRLDLAGTRALWRCRGEQPWRLEGACRRSGCCCEHPSLAVGPLVWSSRLLRRGFLWWQRRVNGFELAEADPESRTFMFRCTHFDRETRRCDSYESRPGICRDYPRLLLWQPNPQLLPGCGYRALPPNAERLRQAVERLELTPEQREKLRSGLRLDG